jgi:hypothetical protein
VNLWFHTLVAAGAVALASSSSAYVFEEDGNGHPLYWQPDDVPVAYELESGNVPAGTAGEAAVHRAFETWSNLSSNLEYTFGGYVSQGAHAYDGRNLVYWVNAGWPYDANVAALTLHYYDTRDGHLLDADILFNGEDFTWGVGGDDYDIENTATHEVGHFSGLGHSADPEATMYAKSSVGQTKKRTLESDDIAGLEALYGGTRSSTQSSSVAPGSGASGVSDGGGGGGGCAISARPHSGRPAELLAVGLLLLWIAARRLAARRARCSG